MTLVMFYFGDVPEDTFSMEDTGIHFQSLEDTKNFVTDAF